MKVIELLKLNRELLKTFREAGIRLEDVKYIDLYNEFRTMHAQNIKVSYIVATLAEKYNISERKVYDLVRRFKSDCNLLAVKPPPAGRPSTLPVLPLPPGTKKHGHEQISPDTAEGPVRGQGPDESQGRDTLPA
mgnify:CR=1 FL=1